MAAISILEPVARTIFHWKASSKTAANGAGSMLPDLSNFAISYIVQTKYFLELADVKLVAAAAEAEALKNNWAVTIAIVDEGGNLLWLQRLDGAAAISAHIAPAKAHSSSLGRRETKGYEDMINSGRTAFLSAPTVHGLLEGGVPIVKDGHVIGAVGVSGVKPNEDAQIAKAGIAALGL